MIAKTLVNIGMLGIVLATAPAIHAQSIQLNGDVGDGCKVESLSTNDVAVGATLSVDCIIVQGFIGAPGLHVINDLAKARAIFDPSGLSMGIYGRIDHATNDNEL